MHHWKIRYCDKKTLGLELGRVVAFLFTSSWNSSRGGSLPWDLLLLPLHVYISTKNTANYLFNLYITNSVITNSHLYRTFVLHFSSPKIYIYYINELGYNKLPVITNKLGQSQTDVITEFDCIFETTSLNLTLKCLVLNFIFRPEN